MDVRQSSATIKQEDCSTIEAAQRLGMAVRSIQLMVDRGDLEAWKTPGGHRRISKASLDSWVAKRQFGGPTSLVDRKLSGDAAPKLLLIEDSVHFQNLVTLLVRQALPSAELHVANDGIAGLAMAGKLEPRLLIIDILLPGIDGATLITSLRSHPQFSSMSLIVVTSLAEADRQPYEFALRDVPVIHKNNVVAELPEQIRRWALQNEPVREPG
jgi:excisionase family DNA binding protein